MYFTSVTIILKGVHVAGHQVYSVLPVMTTAVFRQEDDTFLLGNMKIFIVSAWNHSVVVVISPHVDLICVSVFIRFGTHQLRPPMHETRTPGPHSHRLSL